MSMDQCKIAVDEALLSSAINDSSNMNTLYYAVTTMAKLGLKFDSADVMKSLEAALKKDDSVTSSSYALHIASHLSEETNINKYFELIEDVVAQADEIDGTFLQFDNLFQSALFLDGAFKLAAKVDKKPLITEDQVVMFGNFLLSRKATQSIANAYSVVLGAKILSNNKFQVPVTFSLVGPMGLYKDQPSVQVQVSNLMSGSIGDLSVTTSGVKRQTGSEGPILVNTAFQPGTNPMVYKLNVLEHKPAPDFYTVGLHATPTEHNPALIGLGEGSVKVKVMTEVTVDNMDIAISDTHESYTAKSVVVAHPKKISKGLEADRHQTIILKFKLKSKSGSAAKVHQVFVRLSSVKTKQEVIFTPEADYDSSNSNYKFSLDVEKTGKDFFKYMSGKYTLHLIVGDAIVLNPMSWNFADVSLKFSEDAQPSQHSQYDVLPEIKHLFKVPEKRPPTIVSSIFTGLCLVPVLVLLVSWWKLGVNLSGFTFSLGSVGFHAGLAGILILFYCYWVFLDMFKTLQYLAILSVFTFLTGNRLLSSIAQKKREK